MARDRGKAVEGPNGVAAGKELALGKGNEGATGVPVSEEMGRGKGGVQTEVEVEGSDGVRQTGLLAEEQILPLFASCLGPGEEQHTREASRGRGPQIEGSRKIARGESLLGKGKELAKAGLAPKRTVADSETRDIKVGGGI
jgi:hypothetical protein